MDEDVHATAGLETGATFKWRMRLEIGATVKWRMRFGDRSYSQVVDAVWRSTLQSRDGCHCLETLYQLLLFHHGAFFALFGHHVIALKSGIMHHEMLTNPLDQKETH